MVADILVDFDNYLNWGFLRVLKGILVYVWGWGEAQIVENMGAGDFIPRAWGWLNTIKLSATKLLAIKLLQSCFYNHLT